MAGGGREFVRASNITFGGNGGDKLGGSNGDDLLHGNDHADMLSGLRGKDTLYGGGNDFLSGDENADTVFGGNVADRLDAFGADELSGGAGADTFRLASDNVNNTTITDSETGVDVIDVKRPKTTFSTRTQVGTDTHLDIFTDLVILTGITASSLGANDFI